MNKIILIFFTMIFSSAAFAQFGSAGATDARGMGMAKTSASISTGVNSIGINPANLMFSPDNGFELVTLLPLPSISLRTGTNFISINDFNYFFGGVEGESRLLTEADKKRFNSLFEDGGLVFANFYTDLLKLSYKPASGVGVFAFSISDLVGGKAALPSAMVDLALNGNTTGKLFSLDETDIKSWWLRNYSLSYARDISFAKPDFIKDLFAGISVKMIHGFYYAGTERVNTSFKTSERSEISGSTNMLAYSSFSNDLRIKYDFDTTSSAFNPGLFLEPAGYGFGIDIGFSAITNSGWNFSMALTDIGGINWSGNAAEFTSLGEIYFDDVTNKEQRDSIGQQLSGTGQRIESFSTGLSTAFRLGASHKLSWGNEDNPKSLLLALDYNQGFNNLPGNSIKPRFSFGAEWKPGNYFPYLRTGLSAGGPEGFNWAVGLGIDTKHVEFNFATSDMQSFVVPNSAKYISVALGTRLKF